jgi:putative ABC transport system substrate-binding protein
MLPSPRRTIEYKLRRGENMKRREIIASIGAGLVLPAASRAQQPGRTYRLAILSFTNRRVAPVVALIEQLRALGFVEGRNLVVDPRGFDQIPNGMGWTAQAIARSGVDVMFCIGGAQAIRAAQQATTTVPIVGLTEDMVEEGFVGSLANRSGNTTGISVLAVELDGKRQEILMEALPYARRMAVLADPSKTSQQLAALQAAARQRGVDLGIVRIAQRDDVEAALDSAKAQGAQALNLLASPFFNTAIRPTLFAKATAQGTPTISQWAESAVEGGALAYGPSINDISRQLARMVAKVLQGTAPSQIPIERPAGLRLAINLGAMRAMGLAIPPALLHRADEIVE